VFLIVVVRGAGVGQEGERCRSWVRVVVVNVNVNVEDLGCWV
jgi:hypothetical protein